MRWRKLGRLHVPDGTRPWALTHASVPTVELLDENVARVYVAGRDVQNRSSITWVDVDLIGAPKVVAEADRAVLTPGDLGAFDDSGAMPTWLVRDGATVLMYYVGWNLGVTVPFRNAVGLARKQPDGTFARASSAPILDRSHIDPLFTASVCVLPGTPWRMYYLSCLRWDRIGAGLLHRYHIRYAESVDGVTWQRDGRIAIDFAYENEYAISRPSVLRDGLRYRMWFSSRARPDASTYRIGYAESDDGLTWNRRDDVVGIDVSASGWDSEMLCYPCVFDSGNERYMLYNGNGYGRTGFGIAILEQD